MSKDAGLLAPQLFKGKDVHAVEWLLANTGLGRTVAYKVTTLLRAVLLTIT